MKQLSVGLSTRRVPIHAAHTKSEPSALVMKAGTVLHSALVQVMGSESVFFARGRYCHVSEPVNVVKLIQLWPLFIYKHLITDQLHDHVCNQDCKCICFHESELATLQLESP